MPRRTVSVPASYETVVILCMAIRTPSFVLAKPANGEWPPLLMAYVVPVIAKSPTANWTSGIVVGSKIQLGCCQAVGDLEISGVSTGILYDPN